MNTYDYCIVGAGASGLMMAYKMANESFFNNKSILILDKEKKTTNDRTWCYWQDVDDDWQDIYYKSWNKIEFKSPISNSIQSISPYEYKMIRSKDFYHKIWKVLESKSNFTFLKEEVTCINENKFSIVIKTKNCSYSAKRVLNSVFLDNTYKTQNKYPLLQQHFVGYFIKTDCDSFDDTTATFMDFSIPQKGNTRFMYVLPTSKTEALFEYTLFSKNLLPFKDYKEAIEIYLKKIGIKKYSIVEIEKGAIPMTSYKFWKKNTNNLIHIGTAGGWTKASTGFTFKNTIKETNKLLDFLKKEKSFNKTYKQSKFWFYDLLLLDILYEKNYLGAKLFGSMFKNTKASKILKFLDEETSLKEDLQIILKMPPYYFIRALFKRLF